MAQPWSAVEQSPAYQKLAPQDQQAAKGQYFSEVVAAKPEFQALPENEKLSAASQFMGSVAQPSPEFKTTEEDRKAQVMARIKQGKAESNAQGIMPYVNALGESVVKTGAQILKSPVSVPSQALTDIGQGTPFVKSIKNTADVLTGKKESDYKSFLKSTGAGEGESNVVGNIADIGLYPGGAGAAVDLTKAGVGLVKAGAKGTADAANKGFRYVVDAFTGEAKANIAKNEAKFALKQSTAENTKKLADTASSQVNDIQAGQDAVNRGYQELGDSLKAKIASEADKQGLNLQTDLPKFFQDKSVQYAAEQKSILDSLPMDQRQIPVDRVAKDMEGVLNKFRILKKGPKGLVETDVPLTPAENKVLGIYKDLKNGSEPLTPEDLIGHKKFIRPSAPKYGQQWGSDEKLQSEISGVFANHVPDALKALDTRYAPFMELKDAAITQLKPFAGKYDVSTGVISKSGTPSMLSAGKVDPSEQRLLTDLNAAIGKQVQGKIPGLQKQLDVLPNHQEMIQNASTEAIKKIRADAADAIYKLRQQKIVSSYDIDQATAKIIHGYKLRQLKLGAAGVLTIGGGLTNTVKYFLHREIYSGMKGN